MSFPSMRKPSCTGWSLHSGSYLSLLSFEVYSSDVDVHEDFVLRHVLRYVSRHMGRPFVRAFCLEQNIEKFNDDSMAMVMVMAFGSLYSRVRLFFEDAVLELFSLSQVC